MLPSSLNSHKSQMFCYNKKTDALYHQKTDRFSRPLSSPTLRENIHEICKADAPKKETHHT